MREILNEILIADQGLGTKPPNPLSNPTSGFDTGRFKIRPKSVLLIRFVCS